jgi:hypothetical protein
MTGPVKKGTTVPSHFEGRINQIEEAVARGPASDGADVT